MKFLEKTHYALCILCLALSFKLFSALKPADFETSEGKSRDAVSSFSRIRYSPMPRRVSYIFAHGLQANKDQVRSFIPSLILDGYERYAWDGPEIDAKTKEYSPSHVSLGQERDIAIIRDGMRSRVPPTSIRIGVGFSKGASTLFNAARYVRFDILVLNSPFANTRNLLYEIGLQRKPSLRYVPKCLGKPLATSITQRFIFPQHDPHGLQPIDSARHIPRSTIVVFIASEQDEIIGHHHSQQLYDALYKAGHKNTYLITTDQGSHADLLTRESNRFILQAIHAIYRKHELPFNRKLAKECPDSELAQYQPKPSERQHQDIACALTALCSGRE